MHLQHGTSVLVTDGSKALFLRNDGDEEFPNLRLAQKWEQDVLPDREIRSAPPGRSFSSHDHGTRRSAYDETDSHEQSEAEFTSTVASFLNDEAQKGSIDKLIIVAPPRMLGRLRTRLRRELAERITVEIAKDLVKHPIASIERLLSAYPETA